MVFYSSFFFNFPESNLTLFNFQSLKIEQASPYGQAPPGAMGDFFIRQDERRDLVIELDERGRFVTARKQHEPVDLKDPNLVRQKKRPHATPDEQQPTTSGDS